MAIGKHDNSWVFDSSELNAVNSTQKKIAHLKSVTEFKIVKEWSNKKITNNLLLN
jgi:hypothetical protein